MRRDVPGNSNYGSQIGIGVEIGIEIDQKAKFTAKLAHTIPIPIALPIQMRIAGIALFCPPNSSICPIMKNHWHLLTPDSATIQNLSQSMDCSLLAATLMVNRHITSAQQARRFLRPAMNQLRPPSSLADMDKAAARLARAIEKQENILVFGDYDADGITATVLLLRFLNDCRARASHYIPHRIDEGYGLRPQALQTLMERRRPDLIVTVDCGSSSHQAIAAAAEMGIDTIVTDHHHPPATLPAAHAVVNPKRPDCNADLTHLSGVGLALYLSIAVRSRLREQGFWKNRPEPRLIDYCDLVSIGTVADIVPLTDENRVLVQAGIDRMRRRPGIGIDALMAQSRLKANHLTAENIAFQLAPRINAAGRLDHADLAVDLLMAGHADQARRAAEKLDRLNRRRRELEARLVSDIQAGIDSGQMACGAYSIVLSDRQIDQSWHPGIVGIAAARLARQRQRPVVLISTAGGGGQGSGRSVPNFHMLRALEACADSLQAFGGHAMAAGLSIAPDRIDAFARAFDDIAGQSARHAPFEYPLTIDAEMPLSAIDAGVINEISRLEPFGATNPQPLFLARQVHAQSATMVGGQHCRLLLHRDGRASAALPAIWFNAPVNPDDLPTDFEHLVYRLGWNHYNGAKKMQIFIEDA